MKKVIDVEPTGTRVLIRPDDIEEVSKGGIVLIENTRQQERTALAIGTVLKVGYGCWMDTPGYKEYGPWCKPGDRIIFARNAGMKFWDPITGSYRNDLLLINDLDVTARIIEETDYE